MQLKFGSLLYQKCRTSTDCCDKVLKASSKRWDLSQLLIPEIVVDVFCQQFSSLFLELLDGSYAETVELRKYVLPQLLVSPQFFW